MILQRRLDFLVVSFQYLSLFCRLSWRNTATPQRVTTHSLGTAGRLIFPESITTSLAYHSGEKMHSLQTQIYCTSTTTLRHWPWRHKHCWLFLVGLHCIAGIPKLWGAPPGALLGTRVVCKRDIFTLNEIRAQDKIYTSVGTLLA